MSSATITTYFQRILFRDPTASELSSWTSSVSGGTLSLEQVRSSLINSTEASNFVDPVIRLYQAAFGRVPESSAAIDFYADNLRAGTWTVSQIASNFAASPEFAARYGSAGPNAAYITALYVNVLGRTPAASEVDWYLNTSKMNAAQMLQGFSQSPEFQARSGAAVDALLNSNALGTAVFSGSLQITVPGQTFTLTTDAPSITEGDAGTKALTFTLTLNEAPTMEVVVNYQTLTSGTASSGNDFVAAAGTVTFAVGQRTAAVSVNVLGDTAFEANETVQVQFSGSRLVSSVTATGTITNDDTDPTTVPQTFNLTAGIDNGADFVGANGDDLFVANTGAGAQALTTFDAIDGGGGRDTLEMNVTGGPIDTTLALLATVRNIEVAQLTTAGTQAITANTTAWTGLTTLSSTNSGAAQTITAGAATNTTVVTGAQAANNVAVNGGNNVTVTATGQTTGTVTVGATTAAAGAVAVSATAASGTQGAIQVTGGTSVAVTTNTSNAVASTVNQAAVSVTGTASTTSVSVAQRAAATAAADVVGVVNGAVTIADANAASATAAGTIATVSLTSYGASTIDSSALTTVNLGGTGGTLGIGRGNLDATPTANTLTLNVNGLTGGAITDTEAAGDHGFVTINVAATGAASTIADLTAADATALNISGDARLTFTGNTLAHGASNVTSITSTNTAGVTFGQALHTGVAFTGGDGADSIIVGATTRANTMGGGNDTVQVNGSVLGNGGSIDAGAGTDTLVMTAAHAAAASANATFEGTISNFERVQIDQASAATAINMANLDDISYLVSAGTAAPTPGQAEAQAILIGNIAVASSGTITVGGIPVTLTQGETPAQIAKAIASALNNEPPGTLIGDAIASDGANQNGSLVVVNFHSNSGNVPDNTLNIVDFGILSSTPMIQIFDGVDGINSALTVTNMASGGTLELTDAINGASSVAVTNAATGTADVLNIKLNGTGNIVNAAALTVADVETINIEATDRTAANNPAVASTINVAAAGATTVIVTGNHGVNFTGSTLTNVVTLDASGVVGTGANAAAAATAGAVTFASAVTNRNVTVTTGNGNDVINVSSITDATKGATISTGTGNDNITGGAGADVINAGDGNNTISGGAGANSINAGTGNDTVTVANGNNTINVGAGANSVTVGTGNNTITAGAGADTVGLGAGAGNNTITLGDGANTINSATANGNNTVTGGAGVDTITLGNGNNTISTLGGADVIVVGNGNNNISAGEGGDTITLGTGMNTITLGGGNDTVNLGIPTSGGAYSTITDFAIGDILDFDGTFTAGALGAKITLQAAAGFNDYLDAAAAGGGTALGWFQFGGNTFVVADDNASSTFNNGADSVVALTGLLDLTGTFTNAGTFTFALVV